MSKFIIIAASLKSPKVLGADISSKAVLECQAEGEDVLVYKAPQQVVREVKKLSIEESIDFLEKESVRCNYTTTYPSNLREAGV
jgi:hypothetical protein